LKFEILLSHFYGRFRGQFLSAVFGKIGGDVLEASLNQKNRLI